MEVGSTSFSFTAATADDLQKYFVMKDNWLGSDCATSIPLDGNRALWIWGDTLYGELTLTKERNWTHMPHNAIGVLDLDSDTGFTHYITLEHDALFYPEETAKRADEDEYYWVLQGTFVDDILYLMAITVRNLNNNTAFELIATTVLRVSNPKDEPLSWQYDRIPLANDSWGSALYLTDEYLYIWGAAQKTHVATLARIAVADVKAGQWDRVQAYLKDEQGGEPKFVTKALTQDLPYYPVLDVANPEASVQYFEFLGQYYILRIPFYETTIQIAFSDRLEGPWSPWKIIYNIPPPWNNITSGIFCYAPKSHPELAERENELVISYGNNADQIKKLVQLTKIYVPQMIRVIVTRD